MSEGDNEQESRAERNLGGRFENTEMDKSETEKTTPSSKSILGLATERWIAIGAIAAVIGTAAVVFPLLHIYPFNRSLYHQIEITPPAAGTIPRCATIYGTATVSADETVWVAQRGQDDSSYYNLDKVIIGPGPHRWSITMTVGRAGSVDQVFKIYAFALDDQATQLLDDIETYPPSPKSYFYLRLLPRQARNIATLTVPRDSHSTKGC
jgi:hypothetical protein